ncbi:MAG: OmpA family protein [Caulobacterales bacterium]|nr:OmpA family protein [Caulobacterales bacterium]
MSDIKKRKRNAVAMGVVGLASFMGVAVTGLVIGTSLGNKPAAHTNSNIDWAKFGSDKLAAAGFGFASAEFSKGIVTINGDTNDEASRKNAFEAAKGAILDKISADKLGAKSGVLAFNNAITINGAKIDEIPDALSTLGDKPAAEACQTAYNTLLDGRVINFNSGSANIANDSQALLDKLSEIANRCVDYAVEVGGHTDTKGDEIANQTLSENRAQAVADYLLGKGVVKDQLTIKGYGETLPIDKSETAEAHATNRRIEFKVSQKSE